MSRTEALARRYLEHSPTALLSMIVIDVDHPDTLVRALQQPLTHPPVSWVAEGPSGRGHVGWLLKTPVVRTDAARLAPMRYAARVEEGCRRSLDGDVGYAGLLTKNPLHDEWTTTWGADHLYDLREMADALGELMPRSLPRRAADSSGLGRNCALFNRVRLWAYRARLRYDDRAEWEEVANAYATAVNWEFAIPLPLNEVEHTARSVARWTWRNFSAARFSEIQTARGRKGGRKGGKVVSEAKREANRVRATKVDRAALLAEARA
ncbi:replication initiation protein [Actinomadura kijaniata]|uniref:replication initiation protein n=1 Tax=Actinomadura kijaniata TaxID=46161 RepID=UPI0009FF1B19|nr:replication initiation protein [Actinomadura kijaniata]